MIRKFSTAAILVVATPIGLALIFSFLSPWLPVADSVAHFRFHLTAAMGLAAIILTIAGIWRSASIAWAVSLVGAAGLGPAVSFGGIEAVAAGPRITLVQLNLSFGNATPAAVADLIRREKADVVTLQEVSRNSQSVIAMLGGDYPYRVRCPFAGVGGVAVLSRLPKAPGISQGCVTKQGLAWLRVMAGGKPVSVAAIHLHWPYPYGQARHIDRLQPHLQKIPRPVLLAGDFNAAPWSHAVRRMATATDTAIAGGLRFTFHKRLGRWGPSVGLPIDHILLPPEIRPVAISTGPGVGSDHLPVIAILSLQ